MNMYGYFWTWGGGGTSIQGDWEIGGQPQNLTHCGTICSRKHILWWTIFYETCTLWDDLRNYILYGTFFKKNIFESHNYYTNIASMGPMPLPPNNTSQSSHPYHFLWKCPHSLSRPVHNILHGTWYLIGDVQKAQYDFITSVKVNVLITKTNQIQSIMWLHQSHLSNYLPA